MRALHDGAVDFLSTRAPYAVPARRSSPPAGAVARPWQFDVAQSGTMIASSIFSLYATSSPHEHEPLPQTCPGSQTFVQLPQCLMSRDVSMHAFPHAVVPPGHAATHAAAEAAAKSLYHCHPKGNPYECSTISNN